MPNETEKLKEEMYNDLKSSDNFSDARLKHIDQFSFEEKVSAIADVIVKLLIEKNIQYGNSALDPVRIFSSADPLEQIRVRIDDKLSRTKNLKEDDKEESTVDLIGYLFLELIAKDFNTKEFNHV